MRSRLTLAALVAVLLLTPVDPARPVPVPTPGYHHLGATTADGWSGILGRVTVRDPGVRPATHDFVATRFLAKRTTDRGLAWLEAGWAETGWAGGGRQRIYTYDTNRRTWQFYDQYPVRDGDQVWLYLTARDDRHWQAWLWWGDAWRLLASQELPLTGRAQLEQYVEVYIDPHRGGDYPVPPVAVDNVQIRSGDGWRYWREPRVPTLAGSSAGAFCLDWQTHYDTWTAGTCPLPTPPPTSLPTRPAGRT